MAEFQLQNDAVEFLKVHSDNQQKDTLHQTKYLLTNPS